MRKIIHLTNTNEDWRLAVPSGAIYKIREQLGRGVEVLLDLGGGGSEWFSVTDTYDELCSRWHDAL